MAKTSGELAAGSLGEIVKPTSDDWRDHFKCTPAKRHEHSWLFGTQNAVCSICGKTVSKDKIVDGRYDF
jgi:hypothetical protein